MGYASALGVLNKSVRGEEVAFEDCARMTSSLEFAFVASAGNGASPADDAKSSGIHVFEVCGDRWDWKQRIPSRSPASLSLHPALDVLYVANKVDEHEGMPRGTVEAYKINAHDGTLAFINRQPLSLSGIHPTHIAVSPDGNYLVVAIHGGGAYNVLRIDPDGGIGSVAQILKEVGSGPHPVYQTAAHPHAVVFDSGGQYFFASDEGCDRLSLFSFQKGRMTRTAETLCNPGSGPEQLVLHPAGGFLYVSNCLDTSVDCYRYGACVSGLKHEQRVRTSSTAISDQGQYIALSSSGNFLYAASVEGISVWRVDSITGRLSLIRQRSFENRMLQFLSVSADDRRLFAIDGRRHEILSIPVHGGSRELGEVLVVAKVIAPERLIVRSA